MKSKLINLALAGVFGMSACAAMADEAYQGSWYLLPGVGVMQSDSDLEADNNDVSGFLRLGKELSEHWDIQLGVSRASVDADNNARLGITGGDYKQTLFGVDALYMFSRDSFRPFLLAGLGAARNDIDYNGNIGDNKTSWMANVGAGFQYYFSENWGTQVDLRHVWSEAKDKSDTLFRGDETVGNTYLNIGVIYNFGKPKAAVAAVVPEPVAQEALPDVAAYDEEPVGELMDPNEQAPVEVVGPDKPAFEKITLAAEVLFAFDKDGLRDEGKRILDTEVVDKMKAHPEVELVLITGHTDRIGDDQYNQRLSERRATQVKKYIVSQGIDESRLKSIGKGEKEPVEDCKGVRGKKLIECLQPNRRVVVEVEVQRALDK